MKGLGTFIVRGLAVVAAVFLVLGAWDATVVGWTIQLGVGVLVVALGYGIAGGKGSDVPIVLGLLLMLESALINEFRTAIQVASIIILLATLVWFLLRRRRNQQRRTRPTRENPANWAGNER